MPRPLKPSTQLKGVEQVAETLAGFDYDVDPQDFVLYELHRLIEEDQASFEDSAFRRLMDEGIRTHIEDNLAVRARLAGVLRAAAGRTSERDATLKGEAAVMAMRVVHALEDVQTDLCNVAVLVRSYTTYLLSKLESPDALPHDEKVSTAADLLFESTGDRGAAETALDVLCSLKNPITARILAHAVSEPLLDEDLENRAASALKESWPLPRAYMLYNLREHPHEDIPIPWFQLFVDVDEPTTVELVLDELRVHAENPNYREDIEALLVVLQGCRDPEIEDKILAVLNATSTSPTVLPFLRRFLEGHRPSEQLTANLAWTRREQSLATNRQYVHAAALLDGGKKQEALEALDRILSREPDYALARMLRELAGTSSQSEQ